MCKRTGFTLVELLVVIAIIALLMAILMPALARVRKQAKLVICQSNLKQWSAVFSMYTNDNDSSFNEGAIGGNVQNRLKQWMDATRPYYKDGDLRLCPMATKLTSDIIGEGGRALYTGRHTFLAWGEFFSDTSYWSKGDYGSYGINGWVQNPLPEQAGAGTGLEEWQWRNTNVSGAANIPLFLDSIWFDGWPDHFSDPPGWDGMPPSGYELTEQMKRFCINRHDGGTLNGVFLDFSVRRPGVKQLWTLKWHRKFIVGKNGLWTIAGGVTRNDWENNAPWMVDFKDY